MKKITFAFLLMANILWAQDAEKVWDLLLQNKREEARNQFDKEFAKSKESDIDLLILDAIIDTQNGRIEFDKSFLEKFSKFEESKYYLYPLWRTPFVVGSVASSDFDELGYEKLDYIATAPLYRNDPYVIASKGIADRKRLNYKGYEENLSKIGNITQWQFCGVFENMNGSGHDTEYEPERYANNDKMFNANSNGLVNWYVPAISQKEECHIYHNESEYGNGIVYAQTFIENDLDREVILDFAASGPLKIFINDVEVYSNDKIEYAEINAYHIQFNLKKGVNRLLLKSSITGSADYFYAALKDADNSSVPSLKYYNTYKPYNTSTLKELNVQEIAPYFETYLINKIKGEPNNPLYQIMLYNAYLYNSKNEQAFNAIENLSNKYPSSSLINSSLIDYYNNVDDTQKAEELRHNIILKDEDYFFSILAKFKDSDWLRQSSISELEKYRDKAKKLQSSLYVNFYDYIILLRNSNIDASMEVLERILENSHYNEGLITTFSSVYTTFKNDKEKTISMLEELVSKRENDEAMRILINYYNSNGRKEDAKRLINYKIEHYPYFNSVYFDAITIANGENNYDESLKYSNVGLKNFPYSFRFLEQKGLAYNNLKDLKQAEKYFKQSLTHFSSNSDLRKTLYDITKTPNELDKACTKNIYDLIRERRQTKIKSEYGVVLLFDEYIINVLPEGARKNKAIYVYEVVAENGIEELKEYNLSGNRLNIIKAEIVKPDGSVVPGEQNYRTLVFTNLQVNDVIYIEYETTDNGFGRFYKDFVEAYYFNGTYPVLESTFGIIHPIDAKFNVSFINGEIPSTKSKIGDKIFVKWHKKNTHGIVPLESYSPPYTDLVNKIQISSIKSWSDIANWYSDLVKRTLKPDNILNRTFEEIFPNGVKQLSEEEVAKKIYSYISENITYSSLDFRQSGYVPQKPSKTISTKLGDCKDVSTLFVALAEKAGLKANLVLVQTSDNGLSTLQLPQISFNHCIVKVAIDSKDYFLELTDKYLPFKALPLSLYKAKALIISFDKTENEKSNIISIPFDNTIKNSSKTYTVVDVEDNIKKYTNVQTLKGSGKSYYNELFSDAITEEYRKKEFEENHNQRLGKVIALESVKLISNERFMPEIVFESKFAVSEKLQSVGSLKIMTIPFLDKVYTRDIITYEKRSYDIDYTTYENSRRYDSEIIINLPEGQKFIEFPEGKHLSFKGHDYKITYEIVKPNSLKVTRTVDIPWDNISVADYPEFKRYVEEVIETEEQIIGFK